MTDKARKIAFTISSDIGSFSGEFFREENGQIIEPPVRSDITGPTKWIPPEHIDQLDQALSKEETHISLPLSYKITYSSPKE